MSSLVDASCRPGPPAPASWRLRGRTVTLLRPLVMGVLNVTPDSFSDGGRWPTPEAACAHAERLLGEGADLLDIGGESTAPGRAPIDADEECRRVVPVVEALARRHPHALLSVDTMKGRVAAAALEAGAHVINDVTGGRADPALPAIVARHGAGLVLMHSRGAPGTLASYEHADYGDDVVPIVRRELAARRDAAVDAGVAREAIVLDPGIGFGKRTPDAIALLRALPTLATLGHPLLVGVSRKRIIGDLTGIAEPEARLFGGLGAHVAAVAAGARLVRTHDVAATRQALDAAWPLLAPA
ncbi:MAG: dihydropteroate synthase [Gemmatimonadaceae bacterium]|nr:dihydropteroate synthase [Gemmatimonadaceae bacterium]